MWIAALISVWGFSASLSGLEYILELFAEWYLILFVLWMWCVEMHDRGGGVPSQSFCTWRTLCFNNRPPLVQHSLSNSWMPSMPFLGFREWAVLPQAHLCPPPPATSKPLLSYHTYISGIYEQWPWATWSPPMWCLGFRSLDIPETPLLPELNLLWWEGVCMWGAGLWMEIMYLSLLPLSFPIEPEGTGRLLFYFPFHGQSFSCITSSFLAQA